MKERRRDHAGFEWQGGYTNFSVSQSNLKQVKQYIAGQEEHHRKIGFQDELRALLGKHQIEWSPSANPDGIPSQSPRLRGTRYLGKISNSCLQAQQRPLQKSCCALQRTVCDRRIRPV